jgi:hypothetical protein
MDQRLCGRMILVQDGVFVFLFHRGLQYRKRKILTGNLLILQWYLILTYLSAHLLQLDNLDCHIFMLVEQNWIVKCSWLSMLHSCSLIKYVWRTLRVVILAWNNVYLAVLQSTSWYSVPGWHQHFATNPSEVQRFPETVCCGMLKAGAYIRKCCILFTCACVVFLYPLQEQLL